MAFGKSSQTDSGRSSSSSSHCLMATVVVVLCLVGAWMMTYFAVVPGQPLNLNQENMVEVKEEAPLTTGSKQFEDGSIGLPENAIQGYTSGISPQVKENPSKQNYENPSEEKRVEISIMENVDPQSFILSLSWVGFFRRRGVLDLLQVYLIYCRNFWTREENGGSYDTTKILVDNDWEGKNLEVRNEKEVGESKGQIANEEGKDGNSYGYSWKLCNVTASRDYIPCLDNEEAIRKLPNTIYYEHRERHCPLEGPTCLVPLPPGYMKSIAWPRSRDKIWYHNVPRTRLAMIKGHQNWVIFGGEYLVFPGGGAPYKHGALRYIDFIEEAVPDIAWGKRSRIVLDVGCGVASFGGYLFDRDVLTMSFAPKDEYVAQVQFALERGIPAIPAVMGTQRLPFPSKVFDVVHCARCRVPWHIEGGKLLLELNRVLRPGGYFVWSATPVYQQLEEDVAIWNAMKELTTAICWDVVAIKRDAVYQVGTAIYRKPSSNECYEKRAENNPPLCEEFDDPNAAWYVPLQACMHRVPVDPEERGSNWPEQWPQRVERPPYWLNYSQVGVYGKAAADDFLADYEHWKRVVNKSYLKGLGISWSDVRNVMDMRSVYGGFATALKDMNVWVMNVVTIESPDTLPIIFERGMLGIYHDWCESFSTYPRTYDLLHADHIFSMVRKRCNILAVMAEVDRILRPEGKMIVRDNVETISQLENLVKSLHWEICVIYLKGKEGLLCVKKTIWRPSEVEASMPLQWRNFSPNV